MSPDILIKLLTQIGPTIIADLDNKNKKHFAKSAWELNLKAFKFTARNIIFDDVSCHGVSFH